MNSEYVFQQTSLYIDHPDYIGMATPAEFVMVIADGQQVGPLDRIDMEFDFSSYLIPDRVRLSFEAEKPDLVLDALINQCPPVASLLVVIPRKRWACLLPTIGVADKMRELGPGPDQTLVHYAGLSIGKFRVVHPYEEIPTMKELEVRAE